MSDKKEPKRHLVVERGMVAADIKLVPGKYSVGTEVTEQDARLVVMLGKGRYTERKARSAAGVEAPAAADQSSEG